MGNLDQLTQIIGRLNAGEDPERVREEAREFLATVSPEDLTFAEHELVSAGLAPEDLRHLCSIHMGMLEGEAEKLKSQLQPGHVIHTMIAEHEIILGFLDELDAVNRSIQSMERYEPGREEFVKLRHVAEHLVGAESHHQREEEVLFPEVERRGVFGPPQVMRMEHEELRARKQEIRQLAERVGAMDFGAFKSRLNAASKFIVLTLRDHIFKENNILYPAAVQVIRDAEQWQRMKAACDAIGYCCFTPKV